MVRRPVVVLDPGHGGRELVGTSTPNRAAGIDGQLEKDLVLDVARCAARALATTAEVELTRRSDHNLSLEDRARHAALVGADVFLSLHVDRDDDPAVDRTTGYVSPSHRQADRALAGEVVHAVRSVASTAGAVHTAPLEVLAGHHHLPRTSACVVELAHLTNPDRARWLADPRHRRVLGEAVAEGVRAHLARSGASAHGLDAAPALLDERRRHGGTGPGAGRDRFDLAIPAGERFAGFEVEVLAQSVGAGYRVDAPDLGAEGSVTLEVSWWHLPFGRIEYRVRAWANRDGAATPLEVVVDAPGWEASLRDAVTHGRAVTIVVTGWKAEALETAYRQQLARAPVEAFEPHTAIAIAAFGGFVVLACFAIGALTLGLIAREAMERGYVMRDAGVQTGFDPVTGATSNRFGFTLEPPR